MSLACVDAIGRPSFVLKHHLLKRKLLSATSISTWDTTQLNSKSCVNSLDISASEWRVDGGTACGTQYFAVPQTLMPSLFPLRIDVFLPDQSDIPVALRNTLDSNPGVALRDGESIANLGISRHLCKALDRYCARNPTFLDQYQELPFRFRLVFDNVATNVDDMRLTIVPAHSLERQSISVKSLQKLWANDILPDQWPETVDITYLRYLHQFHDTISVVRLVQNSTTKSSSSIFKSTTRGFEHLYHELRFLLRNPPHPNIMPRPLYVVTKKSLFGGKQGLVGFILPYYPEGSIRDILPARVRNGTLSLSQRLIWCKEVTSALIHITKQSSTFFSELRPDNVLLSWTPLSSGNISGTMTRTVTDSSKYRESVLLCDFEQRGNWHEWCSLEILYCQYAENLRSSRTMALGDRWYGMIEKYSSRFREVAAKKSASDLFDENFVQAKNRAWFSLSHESQEKAQVYSLGLFIYCVFEGLSSVRSSIANSYPIDPDLEFPEMRRTPPAIQELIKKSTIDALEWQEASGKNYCTEMHSAGSPRLYWAKRVIRTRDKLYPEDYSDNYLWEHGRHK